MTIGNRSKQRTRKFLCFLMLLSIGSIVSNFSSPAVLIAAGSRVTDTQTVSSSLEMTTSLAPSTLKEFVQLTIDKLAGEATFKSWKNSQNQYYPLGPGTHSWLVNVMDGKDRIGYLIITAKDEGGYMLSEYGAGNEGLPYSVSDLHQLLVQEGLLPSTYSGTLTLTPSYSPLLPLWELQIGDKKLYINAAVPEILPWSSSQVKVLLKQQISTANLFTSSDSSTLSPQAVYRSGQSSDPYDNILWLSQPKLPLISGDAFTALLNQKVSFVFQSASRNDSFGAPFVITGYQRWATATKTTKPGATSISKVYVVAGPSRKRFVPLSLLQDNGTLQNVPRNL